VSRRKSSHIVQVQATTNNVETRGSVQDELPSNLGTKRNVAPTLPMGLKQSKKRTGSQPHSMFNKIHGNTWKYMLGNTCLPIFVMVMVFFCLVLYSN